MRNAVFFFLALSFITSCSNGNKSLPGDSSIKKIKIQAVSIAETYANGQLKGAKKSISKDGIITIGDNQKTYVIDPAKILVALIDDDSNKDAIVPIDCFRGQYLVLTENLILIKTDGKLMLTRAIESDMKILGIKDRVIPAEIHTRPRNSPLYNCSACKEVVKYQFRGGDLIKME